MNLDTQSAPTETDVLERMVTFEVVRELPQQRNAIQTTFLTWSPTPTWKRAIDILGAGASLVLLSPLLFVIGVYIRFVSHGPAIFKQTRLGEMGRPFTIYKFRTMDSVDPDVATMEHRNYISSRAELDEVIAKPDHKHRLIPGGGFLRTRSLDELPQLFNVLLGNMSLIGPRPDVLDWNDYTAEQQQRFAVKPGISGLWQVSGKNRLSFSKMMELDIEYVEKRSFKFDLWIAFKTIQLILSKDNC